MTQCDMPLRYRISSWYQLPECKSNNSRFLHIHVTDMMGGDQLEGIRIRIDHDDYGTLFAIVLSSRGSLISPGSQYMNSMSTDQVLMELSKYGFLVEYKPSSYLPGSLLTYLMTLKNLLFDKIRVLPIRQKVDHTVMLQSQIVAFTSYKCPKWLNNSYVATEEEVAHAAMKGYAVNISALPETREYDWAWLRDWVANIDDILAQNTEVPDEC